MLEIYTRLGKLSFFGSKAFQKCKNLKIEQHLDMPTSDQSFST